MIWWREEEMVFGRLVVRERERERERGVRSAGGDWGEVRKFLR